MSESLEEITTSEVSDDATKIDDGEINNEETVEETPAEQPDGFAIRDAKIATLEMEKAELDALVTQLRAHNYELLMAAGAGNPGNNDGDNADDTEEHSGGVDELFQSKG